MSYDESGRPFMITYANVSYCYLLNAQGDVVGIMNVSGDIMVEYTYDAWGNVLSITGPMASTMGQHNQLRYRGYVYDPETELYFLNSRFYNPETGRFLNADAFASTGGLLGNNMFAYCLNNPVMYYDLTGSMPQYCLCCMPVTLTEYIYETDYNSVGKLYEYWKDPETGKTVWCRHHTTHGHPKYHSDPHDHEWKDDDNGNNKPGPPLPPNPNFSTPPNDTDSDSNSMQTIGDAVGITLVAFLVYTGIKWVVAAVAAPATGGGSVVVACLTP